MISERTHLAAVADETIVVDDLVGVAVLDRTVTTTPIMWANPAFATTLGRRGRIAPGTVLGALAADDGVGDALQAVVGGTASEQTVRVAVPGGATALLQLSSGGDDHIVVVARAVHGTARAALFDPVTGLASLALFREHLHLGLRRRSRDGDDLAIAAVAVKGFATAWQDLEPSASMLQNRVAERLERVCRDSDVLAARQPGSFLLLVVDPGDAVAAATVVSERMLDEFRAPLVLEGGLRPLDLCIGIGATSPDDNDDRAVARADSALASAMAETGSHYRVRLDPG